MTDGTQRCPQCGHVKPVDLFEGRGKCRPCRDALNARHIRRAKEDPAYRARRAEAQRRLRRRRGQVSVGDLVTAECQRCGATFTYVRGGARLRLICDLCFRHRQEWLYYRLTGPEAARLRAKRVCDICGSPDPGVKTGVFRIDHCHESGVVRGVLCHPCNIAIGLMRDSGRVLRAAAVYVERHQER